VIWGTTIAGAVIVVVVISVIVFRPMPLSPPILPVIQPSNAQPPLQKFDLFFFDVETLELVREERQLRVSRQLFEHLKQILNALLAGSTSGLRNTIPNGTFLYEVYIDDRSIAYLDFSRHLTEVHIGGTTAEILTVQSILRTVHANFSGQIETVQILIEGQEVDTLAGHIDISKPLVLAPEIIASND
jgi:spore germination protein GerM